MADILLSSMNRQLKHSCKWVSVSEIILVGLRSSPFFCLCASLCKRVNCSTFYFPLCSNPTENQALWRGLSFLMLKAPGIFAWPTKGGMKRSKGQFMKCFHPHVCAASRQAERQRLLSPGTLLTILMSEWCLEQGANCLPAAHSALLGKIKSPVLWRNFSIKQFQSHSQVKGKEERASV